MKNPILYQGEHKNDNYFEGWYFKFVEKSSNRIVAIIPGVSKNRSNPHAFIQINDSNGYTEYFKFSIDDFKILNSKNLNFKIDENYFSLDSIKRKLPNILGEITLSNNILFRGVWPNIMGPFSFIPFMQCYHGVVSLNCNLSGNLKINKSNIDFNCGKGYIEKDWGISFPREWIWLQGNSFDEDKTSLMLSLAHIPWLGHYFPGFLGFINIEDKTYYFSTYNFSRVKNIKIDDSVNLVITRGSVLLKINVKSLQDGELIAPTKGEMDRVIKESVSAIISVELYKNKKILYKGKSKGSGLEVVGNVDKLFK